METPKSKLEQLQEDVLQGKLNRRTVLKRAAILGLSAPVIAGLLAACGGEDAATAVSSAATQATGASTEVAGAATEVSAAVTEVTGAATEMAGSPTEPAAATAGTSSTGESAGHGRGVGDLLRILYWQAPTILNTHFSSGTKDSAAASLVLEPLIDITADGTLIPVLAAEVPSIENGGVAEDGMSVTYKLKEGVTWSDGEPFTADDVVFTWEYAADKATTATSFASFDSVDTMEAVDPTTVLIKFKEPNPGWYSVFATAFSGGTIVPKHVLENFTGAKARDAEFNLKPIGTGPYKVTEFKPGDVVMYEINENYREADKPYFKTIEFKGGGDAAAAARAALESNEVDWAWNLQVEKSVLEPMAAGSDTGELVIVPGPNLERIVVNFADPRTEVGGAKSEPTTTHPFLSDLKVRQAFAAGCDRDTVATELYGPAGQSSTNILTSPEKFVSPNTKFDFDPEAGAKMLEEAGFTGSPRTKDGVTLNVIYQTTINPLRQKTQEIIKQGWDQMGITTELKSIDAGVFFSSDAGNPDTLSHFYADFEMFTNGPASPYPITYFTAWKSDNPATDIAQSSNQWAGSNYTRWSNDDFNKLYTQALTELDEAEQVRLFVEMNDMIVNEIVEIPLVHRADVVAAVKKLKGYNPSPWTTDVRDIANWYFEE